RPGITQWYPAARSFLAMSWAMLGSGVTLAAAQASCDIRVGAKNSIIAANRFLSICNARLLASNRSLLVIKANQFGVCFRTDLGFVADYVADIHAVEREGGQSTAFKVVSWRNCSGRSPRSPHRKPDRAAKIP